MQREEARNEQSSTTFASPAHERIQVPRKFPEGCQLRSLVAVGLPAAAALAILTTSASAQSLPSFTKHTSSAVVTEIGTGVSCAWADYDNDGYPDLLVVHHSQPSLLFHNNRDGTFTRITTGHLVTTPASTTGASFGDYDGDGFLDIFITVEDGASFLYHNDGGTNFTLVTNPSVGTLITPSDGRVSGAAWADYNRDGYLDLFVIRPHAGGTNTLYRNNGNGTFTIAPPGAGAPGDHWSQQFGGLLQLDGRGQRWVAGLVHRGH